MPIWTICLEARTALIIFWLSSSEWDMGFSRYTSLPLSMASSAILACQWSGQGHEVCVINAMTDRATDAAGPYSLRRYKMLRGTDRYGFHRFPFQWFVLRGLAKTLREFRPDFISERGSAR